MYKDLDLNKLIEGVVKAFINPRTNENGKGK